MTKFLLAFAGLALTSVALAGEPGGCGAKSTCGDELTGVAEQKMPADGAKAAVKLDIVDTAAANKDFSTLVAAVKAAALVDVLKGKGPFTVFAPTNAAFEKLPKEVLADLLKPENKAKLAGILTYHVVAGDVKAADAVKLDGKMVKTVNGAEFKVVVKDGKVTIGGNEKNMATVTATDIATSNGVIHVIDTVILPPAAPAAAPAPMTPATPEKK